MASCSFNHHFPYLLLLMQRFRLASPMPYPFSSMIKSMVAQSGDSCLFKRNSSSFILAFIWLSNTEHNLILLLLSPFQQLPQERKNKILKQNNTFPQRFSICIYVEYVWYILAIGYTFQAPLESSCEKKICVYFKIRCLCMCMYL